jgi:hypothetical protein
MQSFSFQPLERERGRNLRAYEKRRKFALENIAIDRKNCLSMKRKRKT